jgi:ectoine hydroxylase
VLELTETRKETFDRLGFVTVPDALTSEQVGRYLALHERIYEEELAAGALAPLGGRSNRPGAMHTFAFVLRDAAYLELLDLPTTFPLVVELLGWNIYLYHCHIDQHPPVRGPAPRVWAWHQDGGRQNVEIETEPERPRLSVKVAYFLSDVSEPGRGNMLILPGSHRQSRLPRPDRPEAGFDHPPGAVPVCVAPGAAVLFDRRLWHSRTDNRSNVTRKAFFLGYTYRWVRPRDDYPIDWRAEPYASLSPVRRQLLGWGEGPGSFWGLDPDAVPLKAGVELSRPALDPGRTS